MKRLTTIGSLLAVVTLVAGLFGFAAPAQPVSAEYGNMQWATQTMPGATGLTIAATNVTDFAQSSDGSVTYVVDNTAASTAAAPRIYKTTDGGKSFTVLTHPAAAAATLALIAIAPDNAEVLAVVDTANAVYISSNGASTWTTLPAIAGAISVRDVAVGPARSGTLLGREYVVALADPAAGVALGDVQIIGNTAAWATVGAAAGLSDYVAVAITPNFVGDRSVVALGSGAGAGTAQVRVINTATNALISAAPLNAVGGTTTDFLAVAGAINIVTGSIALPSDFDATTSSGRRGYVAFASGVSPAAVQGDNDVYRFDDTSARALGASTGRVRSISYTGTVDGGRLFEGRTDTADVKYTAEPTVSSPTWTSTKKLQQPGAAAPVNTLVQVAADFATSNKVVVGTSSTESAFSVSMDGGVSFDQLSLVDTAIVAFSNSWAGSTVYMNARSATEISLWESAAPPTSSGWKRITIATAAVAAGAATTRRSPDYATTSTLYFFDTSAVVAPAAAPIYRSTDGGRTWAQRLAPGGVAISALRIAVVDFNLMYIGDGSGASNIYKSTTGGWTWNTPVAANVGIIRSLSQPKPDFVLVGGVGFITYSTDAGATFPITNRQASPNAAESLRIVNSATFATDNTIFLGDAAGATGEVYRFVIGTDTQFEDINAPSVAALVPVVGIALRSNVLYAAYGVGANVVDRTLLPFNKPVTGALWRTTPVPAGVAVGGLTSMVTNTPNITIVVGDGVTVWAFTDYLAVAKPEVASPADKLELGVDPVTGRADTFTLGINAMGTGSGLVNGYQVRIWEKAAGVAAATTSAIIAPSSSTTPQIITGTGAPGFAFTMKANTEYEYQVRAATAVSGAALISPWSDTRAVNVQSGSAVIQQQFGPLLLSPQSGSQSVSLTPGFAWAPIFGATKYKFVLATDAALTKPVAGTPVEVSAPSFQPSAALQNDTTYFFSVQASAPTVGPISIGSFTTVGKPAPPPPPPITIAAPPPAPVITMPPPVTITIPPPPPPPAPITPGWIYAIIAIGAVLVIAVIVLIVRTRRVM